MASGAIAGGTNSAVIVAANEYRDTLTIQLTNSTSLEVAFGETAVTGACLKLINAGDSVTIHGHLARGAVYGIGNGAVAVYQDGDVEYRPGPQVAS